MYVLLNLYREYYERALQIYQQAHGHKHNVAAVLNNLGNTWSDLGNFAKSKELYEETLAIEEEIYGPDHPEVSHSVKAAWRTMGTCVMCQLIVSPVAVGQWLRCAVGIVCEVHFIVSLTSVCL